ncbi:MAG: DUF4293 domain-containing protein [Crocinitomicaceae bacterium]
MLQRIQTIYLVLAFICSILLLFLPIYNLSIIDSNTEVLKVGTIGAYGMVGETTQSVPLYLIFVFSAMLSVLAIFLYKNRRKQLLVCRLNLLFQSILAISFLLVSLFGLDYLAGKYKEIGFPISDVKLDYGMGYFVLFMGIPFILLAIRGIRSDEALLKSLDRLR